MQFEKFSWVRVVEDNSHVIIKGVDSNGKDSEVCIGQGDIKGIDNAARILRAALGLIKH